MIGDASAFSSVGFIPSGKVLDGYSLAWQLTEDVVLTDPTALASQGPVSSVLKATLALALALPPALA